MSTSTLSLFGRAYALTVTSRNGQKKKLSCEAWEPEALRVTFDVLETTLPAQMWFADITIYNVNEAEMLDCLWNASWIELEAGFQKGPNKSSLIWGGPVLQVMFDRENVVDFKITFNSIGGVQFWQDNFINASNGAMSSQYQIVSNMITQTHGNVKDNIGPVAAEKLKAKQYPRGRTLFGSTAKYLAQIAQDNGLSQWIAQNQAYMSELDSGVNMTPAITYGPPFPPGYKSTASEKNVTRSILGVPKMFQYGTIFTVLLDPRLAVVVPPLLVRIDKTVITQFKLIPLVNLPVALDQNLNLIAAQVRHYGDTRGNDWCTEVTGYTRGYAQKLLLQVLNAGK